MFIKAIRFNEVKVGDVVCGETEDIRGEVLRVFHDTELGWLRIVLVCKHLRLYGRPEEIIGLVRRPGPEGKTEDQMLGGVVVLAGSLVGQREHCDQASVLIGLDKLHDAIEAYKLGKPIDDAQGKKPSDPQNDK